MTIPPPPPPQPLKATTNPPPPPEDKPCTYVSGICDIHGAQVVIYKEEEDYWMWVDKGVFLRV